MTLDELVASFMSKEVSLPGTQVSACPPSKTEASVLENDVQGCLHESPGKAVDFLYGQTHSAGWSNILTLSGAVSVSQETIQSMVAHTHAEKCCAVQYGQVHSCADGGRTSRF